MENYTATYEIIGRRVIVALFDSKGEWAGAGRIDVPRGSRREAALREAKQRAWIKGGTLVGFAPHSVPFVEIKEACPERIALGVERRPANALNIEIGTPLARCREQTPVAWEGVDHRASRWLLSGGSPLVLGVCCAENCPRTGKA